MAPAQGNKIATHRNFTLRFGLRSGSWLPKPREAIAPARVQMSLALSRRDWCAVRPRPRSRLARPRLEPRRIGEGFDAYRLAGEIDIDRRRRFGPLHRIGHMSLGSVIVAFNATLLERARKDVVQMERDAPVRTPEAQHV